MEHINVARGVMEGPRLDDVFIVGLYRCAAGFRYSRSTEITGRGPTRALCIRSLFAPMIAFSSVLVTVPMFCLGVQFGLSKMNVATLREGV